MNYMWKILIVDDEPISLTMTERILQGKYKTLRACNGAAAMEVFRKEHPDMVLTDLKMPGMTGLELRKNLMDLYPERFIPFMFMTADLGENNEVLGFEDSSTDFIRKPFRADILLRRIDNILSKLEVRSDRIPSTDPMTGLLSEDGAKRDIAKLCHAGVPGVFMLINLDNFKLVNNLYGRDMGDKLLIRFAEIVCSAVRATDVAGRISGDNFLAFCKGVREEDVIKRKSSYINDQLLISALEYMGSEMNIQLGASIGCVYVPDEGNDFDELYKKAEETLAKVKKTGKHGFSVYGNSGRRLGESKAQPSTISALISSLSERASVGRSAYDLEMDQFTVCYKLLARIAKDYRKSMCFLLFTLKHPNGEPVTDTEANSYFTTLKVSLRRSDIISMSSNDTFPVILLETDDSYTDIIIERIAARWSGSNPGSDIVITHEVQMFDT